jgi:hypothetical protein
MPKWMKVKDKWGGGRERAGEKEIGNQDTKKCKK